LVATVVFPVPPFWFTTLMIIGDPRVRESILLAVNTAVQQYIQL
jgi:hypothetical protein